MSEPTHINAYAVAVRLYDENARLLAEVQRLKNELCPFCAKDHKPFGTHHIITADGVTYSARCPAVPVQRDDQ